MQRLYTFYLLFVLTVLSFACKRDEAVFDNSLKRQPYIQKVGKNEATIRWRTFHSTPSVVQYGSSPDQLTNLVVDSIAKNKHRLVIKNLEPGTKYYYSVGEFAEIFQKGPENYFVTAPAVDKPTRIWVLGDAGTGKPLQNKVRDAYLEKSSDRPTDLWLWLGDNAYMRGTDEEYQEKVFMGHYEKQMQNLPVYSIPGNHDMGGGYLSAHAKSDNHAIFSIFDVPVNGELGGVPSNSLHYYSMDYSNIHFIMLDSYGSDNSPGSPMYNWLEEDLKANKKKWIVAAIHHPPYSKGSHNSDTEPAILDIRKNIVPLLEKYGVDLVLSGHSHSYQRSYFINGHYGKSDSFKESMKVQTGDGKEPDAYLKKDTKGTVYVVAGSGGQLDYKLEDYPHEAMAYSTIWHGGSVMLDINGNKLTSKFINANSKVLDEFTIIKE